jgi:transcriptional regulator with XRE-family HTH domain
VAFSIAMDTRQIIGWNLRRLRVAKGISQERLALEAAIDRAYVGRVERGEENVTVSTLEALAAVLAAKVAELFIEPAQDAKPTPPLRAGRKPKPTV